ncbi:MAG: DUF3124 domain-containing protein [Bacteroidota bacterium]
MKNLLFFVAFTFLLVACDLRSDPNVNKKGVDKLEQLEVYIDDIDLAYMDTVYVPIYSDIYSQSRDTRVYLTATLSIRNTSLTDSMYLKEIDYYDTGGQLVREYIDNNLLLTPMQSIDYVIEENDVAGGTGANFILVWGAKEDNLKPLFQGVMLSTAGQQGISFLTEGISISRR